MPSASKKMLKTRMQQQRGKKKEQDSGISSSSSSSSRTSPSTHLTLPPCQDEKVPSSYDARTSHLPSLSTSPLTTTSTSGVHTPHLLGRHHGMVMTPLSPRDRSSISEELKKMKREKGELCLSDGVTSSSRVWGEIPSSLGDNYDNRGELCDSLWNEEEEDEEELFSPSADTDSHEEEEEDEGEERKGSRSKRKSPGSRGGRGHSQKVGNPPSEKDKKKKMNEEEVDDLLERICFTRVGGMKKISLLQTLSEAVADMKLPSFSILKRKKALFLSLSTSLTKGRSQESILASHLLISLLLHLDTHHGDDVSSLPFDLSQHVYEAARQAVVSQSTGAARGKASVLLAFLHFLYPTELGISISPHDCLDSLHRGDEGDEREASEQPDLPDFVWSVEKKSIFAFLENRFRRLIAIKPCWGKLLLQNDRSFRPSFSSSCPIYNEEEKKDFFSTASYGSLSPFESSSMVEPLICHSSPSAVDEEKKKRKNLLDHLPDSDRPGEEEEEVKEKREEERGGDAFRFDQKKEFFPPLHSSSLSSPCVTTSPLYESNYARQASSRSSRSSRSASSTGAVAGSTSLSRDSSSLSLLSHTKGPPSTTVSMVSQGGGKGRIDDHDDEGDRERDTIDRVDDLNKINHEKEEEEEAQTVFSAGTAFTWEIREKVNYELKMKKQRQQEEEERGKKKERKAILSASDEEELNGLLQALQILSWNMTDREKSIWTQGNGAVLWRCCGSVLFDTSLFSSSSLGSSLSSRRREKQEERETSSLLLLFNSLLSGSLGGGGGVAESRVGSEVAFLARRSTEYARNRPVSSSSSSQVSMPSSGSLLTKMSGDPSSHAKSEGADKEEEKEEEREGEEKMKKEEGEGEEGEGEREKNKKKAGEGEDRKERICVIHGSPSVSDFAQAACKDSRPSSAAATKLHIDAPRQEKEETIPGHSSPPPSSSSITPTRDTSLSSSLACNLDTSLVIPTTTAAPPSSSLLPSSPPCSLPSLFASCSPSSISSSFSPLSLESSNLRSSSPSHPLLLQTDLKNRSITQLTRSVLRDLPSSSCSLSSSMSSFTSSSSQFFFSSSTPVSSVSPSPSFFLSSSRLKESIGSIIRSCSPSLLSACAAILASLFESFWRTQGLFSVFPPTISSSSSSIEHSISLVSGDPLHPASQLRSYLQENVYLVYHALELLGRSNSSCYVKSLRSSTRQESLHISAIFREILATVSGEVFLKREEERSSTSEALTGPCTSLCMIKSGEDSDKRKKKSSSFEGEDKARRNKIQIVFTGWEKRQKILWLRGFFKHSLSQHLRDDSSAFLSFFLFGASRWKRPEGSEETRRGARRMTENDPNLCRRDKESDCREFSSSSFASSFASWRTSKHREKVRAHQRQARNSVRTLLMNPGMSED